MGWNPMNKTCESDPEWFRANPRRWARLRPSCKCELVACCARTPSDPDMIWVTPIRRHEGTTKLSRGVSFLLAVPEGNSLEELSDDQICDLYETALNATRRGQLN